MPLSQSTCMNPSDTMMAHTGLTYSKTSASSGGHNLHTLPGDVLHEILLLCPTLRSLYHLVETHPAIYRAFDARRRLILRTVFDKETRGRVGRRIVDALLARTAVEKAVDAVALREALYRLYEPFWPTRLRCKLAMVLLHSYRAANMKDEALAFAKSLAPTVLSCKSPMSEARLLARALVQTYEGADLAHDALQFQESFLHLIKPQSPEHNTWAKDLVARYQTIKGPEQACQLQGTFWELYQTTLGPGNDITLSWARLIVSERQSAGQNQQAVAFHQQVRRSLDPASAQYVAWSRQQIKMLQKLEQDDKAILVTEDVWRHLQPESPGYRAWTAQLSDQYEAAGRSEDAIAVCQTAWTTTKAFLDGLPNDKARKYRARGAALLLAKAYRRNNQAEDANSIEAISESYCSS
ncbi:hypothetical protein BT63DRAFT_136499 [Microthyrium microscopicum]|uniref:Uncharacterized protein n=1 Tax=Microthyrium microscopicum TaxID=703497 RepID=A0A6A6UKI4_9PEZI|nr:hypothetical protein BT63DRAFT_136499 [Microthyrium microscopicum]